MMRMEKVAVLLLAALLPAKLLWGVHAMETGVTQPARDSVFSIKGQLGVLNGEAHELVYGGAAAPGAEDYKLSELIWDLESVVMGGVVASIGPGGPLTLNAGLWFGLTEGDGGEMYDYDWMDPSRPDWTDKSRSEVDVINAVMIDLNIVFKPITGEGYSLGVMGGLKIDMWEWDDRGREFTYSVNGFRDLQGNFGGQNVIDYEQLFVIPYIGVEAAADLGGLSVQGYLAYSALVVAADEDHHILRELHFKETFTGGDYFAIGGTLTLDIGEAAFVQISAEYQNVDEIIGDMEIEETDESNDDGAGISHEATMISAAVGIRL